MAKDIQFIYFDVGGVLLRWREVFPELARRHKISPKIIEEAYNKYEKLSCRGLITPQQIWQAMQKELHIPQEENPLDFSAFSLEVFSPIEEMHVFVKDLAKSMPVGLLTNVHLGFFDKVIAAGRVPNIAYRVIVQSCEVGMIKPERGIYKHAQKIAAIPGENILFVDDLEINVTAAKRLGWQALVFDTDRPEKSIAKIKRLLKK